MGVGGRGTWVLVGQKEPAGQITYSRLTRGLKFLMLSSSGGRKTIKETPSCSREAGYLRPAYGQATVTGKEK